MSGQKIEGWYHLLGPTQTRKHGKPMEAQVRRGAVSVIGQPKSNLRHNSRNPINQRISPDGAAQPLSLLVRCNLMGFHLILGARGTHCNHSWRCRSIFAWSNMKSAFECPAFEDISVLCWQSMSECSIMHGHGYNITHVTVVLYKCMALHEVHPKRAGRQHVKVEHCSMGLIDTFHIQVAKYL